MSEFGNALSHSAWRDPQMERGPPPGVPGDQAPHPDHRPSQPNLYERYSPPPPVPETEEWSSSGHNNHAIGSPHSQASSGSIMGSPHSQQSDNRRSVDIGGSGPSSSHGDPQHMSLSERRQEKRKMKRFRLTHNQTRFLMSEFARQAHPDAAHRERLAREIPGLSPRQVQVWFQNRRAKLKRMSSDDRERMMKSRALPEEFPILQTLHTYGGPRMGGTPVGSPSDYSPSAHGSVGYPRPDLRRRHLGEDEVAVSPTSPAYPGLPFAPNTPNASEILSPGASGGERPSYLAYMPLGPQQRGNPFSRASDPYRQHQSVPRLQLHDNTPRSIGEHASSPLTAGTTYSNHTLGQDDYQQSPAGYSIQGLPYGEAPRSVPPDTPASPYVHSNPASAGFTHSYPSPAPASSHGARPSNFPPPLTLSEYKYPHPPLTPHSGTMSGFATAPLAPPQEYQIPQMSAPADATSFGSSYLTRSTGSVGSTTASSAPSGMQQQDRDDRLSAGGREYGHKRQRSSSQPPNFPENRPPS